MTRIVGVYEIILEKKIQQTFKSLEHWVQD